MHKDTKRRVEELLSLCKTQSLQVATDPQEPMVDGRNERSRLIELNLLRDVRHRTFSHWPDQIVPGRERMIAAGFFHCNVGDRTICIYCDLICQQWSGCEDDPSDVHQTLSPHCPYVLSMLTPAGDEGPCHSASASTSNRHASFQTWSSPSSPKVDPLDESLLSRLVAARIDLPASQRLLDQNVKPSVMKRCWEDQLRLKRRQDGAHVFHSYAFVV
jgi:hypothetical protein